MSETQKKIYSSVVDWDKVVRFEDLKKVLSFIFAVSGMSVFQSKNPAFPESVAFFFKDVTEELGQQPVAQLEPEQSENKQEILAEEIVPEDCPTTEGE